MHLAAAPFSPLFPRLLPTTPSLAPCDNSFQPLLPKTPSNNSFPQLLPTAPLAPSISPPFQKYLQQLLPSAPSNNSLPKLLLTNPLLSFLNLNQQFLNPLHNKCLSALTPVYLRKQKIPHSCENLNHGLISDTWPRWQKLVNNKSVILLFRGAKVPCQVK